MLFRSVAALSVGDPFVHEEALLSEDRNAGRDEEDELSGIHDGDVKAKELNKLRRKAFFKSQEVGLTLSPLLSA